MDMQDNREQLTLTRDVEAALVPVGDRVTLKAGERATVTQALGGSYTVVVGGNMYRIDGKDAEALGKQPVAQPGKQAGAAATRDEVEESIWEALRSCYDPEIPINIYDLGLVYNIDINESTGKVEVKMTLTAPGCPASAYMGADVKRKIEQLPGVKEANVAVVWEPPWTPEMMSETAKKQFGWGL